jgi:hypothetical protein
MVIGDKWSLESRMGELVPVGYLSRHEAIDVIARSLVAGTPERSVVTELRGMGIDAADGLAIDKANAELWRGVDRGAVDVFASGPNERRFRMEPSLTEQVPFLRSPRGGDFTYARPRTSAHRKLVAQFGPDLGSLSLAFSKREVEKWARSLLRKRRKGNTPIAGKRRTGRPPRQALVMPVIRKLLDEKKWNATMSLKALTQEVNRRVNSDKTISEETVTRALDQLYEVTGDRQFQRVHRRAA